MVDKSLIGKETPPARAIGDSEVCYRTLALKKFYGKNERKEAPGYEHKP